MSLLRDNTCEELISRMECLRICIDRIDKKNIVASTELWLVSAEKVDWKNGADGHGIPVNIFDNDKTWATKAQRNIKGNGYLYVFAKATRDHEGKEVWVDSVTRKGKRRRQTCTELYICQVTEEAIAWCEIVKRKCKSSGDIKWKK